jgi:hypothetical protein
MNATGRRDAFAFPIANLTFLIKPYRHGTWQALSLLVDVKLYRQYDVYYLFALMKACLISLFVMMCLSPLGQAADEKPKPDATVVKLLRAALPHDPDKRAGFLWDHFANKPEADKFSSYGTDKWKDNFAAFAEALATKAKAQKLDAASLRKALDQVLKDSRDEIAYLPVGAYQTNLDRKPVWIIAVKWEYPSMGEEGMVHIRMFAFDQKTLERVGYSTCL